MKLDLNAACQGRGIGQAARTSALDGGESQVWLVDEEQGECDGSTNAETCPRAWPCARRTAVSRVRTTSDAEKSKPCSLLAGDAGDPGHSAILSVGVASF